jgi:serine/threonine-protein kinase
MGVREDHGVTVTETATATDHGTQPSFETPRQTGDGDPRAQPLPPGFVIDRYAILEPLGQGGMGVVYAAYDPELDRRIALKMLLPTRTGERATTRLLREAQALAKLAHPNVVAVHDAGKFGDQLYIAMEFVRGQPLDEWVQLRGRSPDEVVAIFVQAGHGLAAAHRVGIIHRDFKPTNVLVGDDGRVRVLDFGLARAAELDESIETPTANAEAPFVVPLTQTGAVMGTPAYMAPEQHLGESTDTRTDQFSFCVALWEALYGQRPFPGKTAAELAANVLEGEIGDAPRGSNVSGQLEKTLRRGLSREPAQRFEDMEQLLAVLEPKRRKPMWPAWAGGVAIAGSLVAGYFGTSSADSVCGDVDALMSDVWDEDREARVRDALVASGATYAASTSSRVEAHLDRYTEDWSVLYREQCESHAGGEISSGLYDLQVACLERRRSELDALLGVFEGADTTIARNAIDAVRGLSPVEPCSDAQALLARVPPPSDEATATRVAEIRTRLDEAEALEHSGLYDRGLAIASETAEAAAAVGYDPVHAEALYRRGALEQRAGDYDASVASLSEAYWTAMRADHASVMVDAASWLVVVLGFRQTKLEPAHGWYRHANALIDRTGRDTEAEAQLASHYGLVLRAEGKLGESARAHRRAIEIRERVFGPNDARVANSLVFLGVTLRGQAEYAEAAAVLERATAILEDAFGPDHPETAAGVANLGATLSDLGRLDESLAQLERALSIEERALGAEHPHLAVLLSNIGGVYRELGRYEEAIDRYERAMQIDEKVFGPEHANLGYDYNGIAIIYKRQGAWDEALERYERAASIWSGAFGEEHELVAIARANIGEVYGSMGDQERAMQSYGRARAIWDALPDGNPKHREAMLNNMSDTLVVMGRFAEACENYETVRRAWEERLGPEHVQLAFPLTGLGRCNLGLGKTDVAIGWLEKALALRAGEGATEPDRAMTKLALAEARWRNGQRPEARKLAEEAKRGFEGGGSGFSQFTAEAESWLAAHR